MHPLVRLERLRIRLEAGLDRLLGAAQATLAVDHQCEVAVESTQATVGAEFAQREGEIARAVRRDRERLPSDRDPSGPTACRQRVLVRQLGVVIDEERDHSEVPGDALLDVCLQRLQLVAGRRVQIARFDLVRKHRVLVLGTNGTQLVLEPLCLGELTVAAAPVAAPAATGAAATVVGARIALGALGTVVTVPAVRGARIAIALRTAIITATVRGTSIPVPTERRTGITVTLRTTVVAVPTERGTRITITLRTTVISATVGRA
ncbi:hypothetical protein D3230_05865 [Leucobacter chromiireducens subsp. solipictus]|uniref:Uncharacterized protein n=1 Tax=Leucobacter chromiireducens subsp. solipictus TaxID=398235 RepID=A0ABS1SE44_9MICO|nr:hypothetical protein [Leucobacter chromiireducens subsp. solipictus]